MIFPSVLSSGLCCGSFVVGVVFEFIGKGGVSPLACM